MNTVLQHGIGLRVEKKIIHIDFSPAEIDKDYLPNVEVIGDLAGALYQLNKALLERLDTRQLPLFKIESRQKLRSEMAKDLDKNDKDNSFPMKPQRILLMLEKL